MTLDTLSTFFGWMTVFNFALLAVAGIALMAMRDWASELHARMFGLEAADVRMSYFRWLATYKILALVFAFVPWLALQMI